MKVTPEEFPYERIEARSEITVELKILPSKANSGPTGRWFKLSKKQAFRAMEILEGVK